jgi:hypothetical protein
MSELENVDVCYICLEKETKHNKFHLMGCQCSKSSSGSQHIHKKCYNILVRKQGTNKCSVCKEIMKEMCMHSGRELVYKEINDELMAKYTINEKGKKEGSYYEIYRTTGDVRKLMDFIGGKAHGEMSIWWPDGSIHLQGEWKNGMKHGQWMEFDEDPMMGYAIIIYFQDALIEYSKYNRLQELVDYENYGEPHMNELAKELADEMHGNIGVYA